MAWGLAAITAAELEYIEDSSMPSWLNLTEGVFQAQVARWDTGNGNGGLRWQIWPYKNGYNTKDATSNGGIFQLSVRLARCTKNQTYSYGAYTSGAAYMYIVVSTQVWIRRTTIADMKKQRQMGKSPNGMVL